MGDAFARPVRSLGRAKEVRATIGKIAANRGATEFVAADLNSDTGWADAVGGADVVLHVRLLSRQSTRKATRNWFDRRVTGRFECSRPHVTRASSE